MISIVVKMIQDLEAWQDRKRTWHTTGAALRRAFPFVQDQDQDFVLLAGLSRCMGMDGCVPDHGKRQNMAALV